MLRICLIFSPRNLGMKIQVDLECCEKKNCQGLAEFRTSNKTCLMFSLLAGHLDLRRKTWIYVYIYIYTRIYIYPMMAW